MKLICSSVYTFILKILSTYYMLEDQPLDYLDRERKCSGEMVGSHS